MRAFKSGLLFLTPLVAAFGLSSTARSAPGLKCGVASTIVRANGAKAVFSGKVVSLKKSGGLEVVRFRVSKSWKHVRAREVTVINYRHHEAPQYTVGRTYVVFANGDGSRLTTGICSGTFEAESSQDVVKQLDRWQAEGKAVSRPRMFDARSLTTACTRRPITESLMIVE